jgi:hypothetical protein
MSLVSASPNWEVKKARINVVAAGESVLIAAVASKKLRIVNIDFTVSSVVTLEWRSNGTAIKGPMYFDIYGGEHWLRGLSESESFCETVAGEDFRVFLSGASALQGSICYQEI